MSEAEQSGPAGQPSEDEQLPADHDGQPPAEAGGPSERDDEVASPEPDDQADSPTSPEPDDQADSPEPDAAGPAERSNQTDAAPDPGSRPDETGHPEVDSALAGLAALDQDLATSEHPPIFEATLRDLQRALADNPGAEPGEPAQP